MILLVPGESVGHFLQQNDSFHALNQPLTGLQCSLELALAVARTSRQHTRTLREGLALTARMRVLVEVLRELVYSSETREAISDLGLDAELAECVDQLRAVAAAKAVEFEVASRDVLSLRADRSRVAAVLLRTITAAIGLCQEASKSRDRGCRCGRCCGVNHFVDAGLSA